MCISQKKCKLVLLLLGTLFELTCVFIRWKFKQDLTIEKIIKTIKFEILGYNQIEKCYII